MDDDIRRGYTPEEQRYSKRELLHELRKLQALEPGGLYGFMRYYREHHLAPKVVFQQMFGDCSDTDFLFIMGDGNPDARYPEDHHIYDRAEHICGLHNILPDIIKTLLSDLSDD